MQKIKYYKCPECNMKFKTLSKWATHMDNQHPSIRPEGYSDSRFFYFILTGKTHGICPMSKKPTEWNEATQKYKRFYNAEYAKEYTQSKLQQAKIDQWGKVHRLDEADMQKKMLAKRKISGEYKFQDGVVHGYTGKYELDFLMMLDQFLRFDGDDILSPSPHTYEYEYEENGKKSTKFYIPDFYIPSLNLEIEIKQSESSHKGMQATSFKKDKAKEKMMEKLKHVNYIKLYDKKYTPFFNYLDNSYKTFPNKAVKYNNTNRNKYDEAEDTITVEINKEVALESALMAQKGSINRKLSEFKKILFDKKTNRPSNDMLSYIINDMDSYTKGEVYYSGNKYDGDNHIAIIRYQDKFPHRTLYPIHIPAQYQGYGLEKDLLLRAVKVFKVDRILINTNEMTPYTKRVLELLGYELKFKNPRIIEYALPNNF